MISLVKAIQERLAKICEDYAMKKWHEYKRGSGPGRANPHWQGESDGGEDCAAAIRAADLSDLEPKGATPRVDAAEIVNRTRYVLQPRAGFPDMTALARQLETELTALTARLEAAEGELEHALLLGDQLADWINVAAPALKEMADAYERRIRTLCSQEELAKRPWECAEWNRVIAVLHDKPIAIVEINAAKDSHE